MHRSAFRIGFFIQLWQNHQAMIYLTAMAEGNGWEISQGWITVKNATSTVVLTPQLILNPVEPNYDAENKPYFVSQELNSAVYFSDEVNFAKNWIFNSNTSQFRPPTSNGHPNVIYFKTTDNNDPTLSRSSWWRITNIFLQLTQGATEVRELAIKARDSKVTVTELSHNQTILSQKEKSTTYMVDEWLNYSVSGIGQQSTKAFLALNQTTHNSNIAVFIDGIARENGDGWEIQSDETETWLTVNSAKSNVSIHTWSEYTAGPFGWLYVGEDYSFIIIVSVIVLALIFALIIGILTVKRKRSSESIKRFEVQESSTSNQL